MSSLKHLQPRYSRAFSFVRLLLVFSFLFNPYLTAQASGGSLAVRHPASHRATVGSSELEKYSPAGSQHAHWLAVLSSGRSLTLLPAMVTSPAPREGIESFLPRPQLYASLWFRPPPAL